MPAARRCSARAPYGVYELPLAHRMTEPWGSGVRRAARPKCPRHYQAAKRCSDAGRKPRNHAASRPGFPVTGRLCVRRLAPQEPILSAATAAKWQRGRLPSSSRELQQRVIRVTDRATTHRPILVAGPSCKTSRPQRSLFEPMRTLTVPHYSKEVMDYRYMLTKALSWACWSLHPALSLHRE